MAVDGSWKMAISSNHSKAGQESLILTIMLLPFSSSFQSNQFLKMC